MHTFTINGTKYIPWNNSLFRIGKTVTSIQNLQEEKTYLHNGTIGTFEVTHESLSYSAFDAIFRPQNHPESKTHYTITETGNNIGETFTSAKELDRLVPDQLAECPNCESAAGEKDDDGTPRCFNCGYGTKQENS
jgi:hypothetical protein